MMIALSIVTAACGGDDEEPAAEAPTPAETPAPAETETPAADESVLLQDDFSADTGAWHQAQTEQGTSQIIDGLFSISVDQPGKAIFSGAELELGDDVAATTLSVEADVTKPSGAEDSQFGVLCMQDADNYYVFAIATSDQATSGIAKVVDAQAPETLQQTEFQAPIQAGSAPNHVTGNCVIDAEGGPTELSLAVNGQVMVQAQDATGFPGPGFTAAGLIVYTASGPAQVEFDNLLATDIPTGTGGI